MSASFTPAPPRASQQDLATFDALFRACARIGATPSGGVHRLAATAADGAVRDRFCAWLRAEQFEVRIDPVGNIFGLMTLVPGAPYVLCGSHLDSQPNAGRFDGAYGVTAGAVAVASLARQLRARNEPPMFNLAVVNWTNEEGARFQPSLMGSAVFTGAMPLEQAWTSQDAEGITLKQALQQIGYVGEAMEALPVAAYIELHVEQGPHLEQHGSKIGVVEETWAALKWQVHFQGEQNHTGPSLMAVRRDALLAAAQTIIAVRAQADKHNLKIHSSVGRLEISPNSPNVVAAEARLHIEFRSADEQLLHETGEAFQSLLQQIATTTGTTVSIDSAQFRPRRQLAAPLAALAWQSCNLLDIAALKTRSVAGHDAISMSYHCPSSLLFIPSANGLSHNEAEFTTDEDMHHGVAVLVLFLYLISTQPEAWHKEMTAEEQAC